MKMNTLHELFCKSEDIKDELFSLDNLMKKLKRQRKKCVKTKIRYSALLDELRGIEAHMRVLENVTA